MKKKKLKALRLGLIRNKFIVFQNQMVDTSGAIVNTGFDRNVTILKKVFEDNRITLFTDKVIDEVIKRLLKMGDLKRI